MHWASRGAVEEPGDGATAGAGRSTNIGSGTSAINVFERGLGFVGVMGFGIGGIWRVLVRGFAIVAVHCVACVGKGEDFGDIEREWDEWNCPSVWAFISSMPFASSCPY